MTVISMTWEAKKILGVETETLHQNDQFFPIVPILKSLTFLILLVTNDALFCHCAKVTTDLELSC